MEATSNGSSWNWPLRYGDKPIHSQILRDRSRYRVLVAGRRGGKTAVIRTRAMQASVSDPGLRWYITPTLEQGRDEFYSKLIAECQGSGLIVSTNDTRLELHWVTGAVTQCKSVKDAKYLRARGLKEAWCDEFQDWPWNAWDAVVRPMLADHQAPAIIAGTVNGRGSQFHQFFRRGVQADETYDRAWRSWLWTAYEAGTVASEEIQAAERDAAARGPTALKAYRREWMADWDAFEGQVFEEWQPERMVVPELPKDVRIVRSVLGVDWGFSSEHYGVMQVWGCDQRDRWWMLEEVAQPSQTWSYWMARAEALWVTWKYETAWAPDDQPGGVKELRERAGDRWRVRAADRSKRKQRVMALAELMHTGRFHLVGRGTKLESEIPGYQWERMTDGTLKDEPKKGKDDGIDCCGYALYSEATRYSQVSYA